MLSDERLKEFAGDIVPAMHWYTEVQDMARELLTLRAEVERLRGANPDAAIGAARAADALATGNLDGRCHKCGYRLPKTFPHKCPNAAISPPEKE